MALANFEVDNDAEMIARPYAIYRLVEAQLRGLHPRMRVGVGVPTANEDVVETISVTCLSDYQVCDRFRVGIVDSPGMARKATRSGHEVRRETLKFLINEVQSPRVALGVPHIQCDDANAHG